MSLKNRYLEKLKQYLESKRLKELEFKNQKYQKYLLDLSHEKNAILKEKELYTNKKLLEYSKRLNSLNFVDYKTNLMFANPKIEQELKKVNLNIDSITNKINELVNEINILNKENVAISFKANSSFAELDRRLNIVANTSMEEMYGKIPT